MEDGMTSQSLFQWTVFCNILFPQSDENISHVSQSLFQWTVFCNIKNDDWNVTVSNVSQSLFQWTVFCNQSDSEKMQSILSNHNPCFSGQCFAIANTPKGQPALMISQSLFQWTVFCNDLRRENLRKRICITILVLVDSVLQYIKPEKGFEPLLLITILVLVDSVLQQ